MRDDSTYKSPNRVPAINLPDQDILDDLEWGLNNILDEKEKAHQHNLNVLNNTKDKENIIWPNKDNHKIRGMADGLKALETLGTLDIKDAESTSTKNSSK